MLCRELLCRCSCNIYACWPRFTATNTAAVQAYLLVECAARWVLATLSACLSSFCHSMLHLCWLCASLAAIPASMVSHHQPYLMVWCRTIGHACSCGVSLNAMHSSIVLHYQPCLLVWCFIIGHAFWCGTSQSSMPVCVVPHYRSYLLVWYLNCNHAFWCGG